MEEYSIGDGSSCEGSPNSESSHDNLAYYILLAAEMKVWAILEAFP